MDIEKRELNFLRFVSAVIIASVVLLFGVMPSYAQTNSGSTPSETITKLWTVKNIKVKVYQPDKRVTGNRAIAKWNAVSHANGY